MAWKFLYNNSGVTTEREAITSSAGAGDSGKIPGLDGSGRLDSTFMPVGIGAETKLIAASEDLSAGELVNIYDDTGAKVRLADASNGRVAHGFVLASVTNGNNATVYLEGTVTGLTSLTPGARMYLSGSSAGAATATAPSSSGYYLQPVGYAISTTEMTFEPQEPIVLA